MKTTEAQLVETADGSLTLCHPDIDEDFHSKQGAATEAVELYIKRGGLQSAVLNGPVEILDVGFGLGYNAVHSMDTWLLGPGSHGFHMVSLEKEASLLDAISVSEGSWQQGWPKAHIEICQKLKPAPYGFHATLTHPRSGLLGTWKVILGDAASSDWQSHLKEGATHIWQDAFSPKNNPLLWSESWFKKLRDVAQPKCIIMTYSVARVVRDAMAASGFKVERIPALGVKKHWLKGYLESEV